MRLVMWSSCFTSYSLRSNIVYMCLLIRSLPCANHHSRLILAIHEYRTSANSIVTHAPLRLTARAKAALSAGCSPHLGRQHHPLPASFCHASQSCLPYMQVRRP